MKEIIFTYYNGERCHAAIVENLSVEPTIRNYVGDYRKDKQVYEVYRTNKSVRFDQFGFEAIRKETK